MGYLLTLGCYLVAFSPAAVLFLKFAASDPLKTILFFVGSFVWLLSLLATALVWVAIPPLYDHPHLALAFGVIFQELARIACFFMLRAAQKGLASMANPGSAQRVRVTGVHSLANSRHLLALVVGLGMGTAAGLFLTMNAFDAVSGSAVVGGIKQMLESGEPVPYPQTRFLPMHWAANAGLLSLAHPIWTTLMWESCHQYALRRDTVAAVAAGAPATPRPLPADWRAAWWQRWWMPAACALLSHAANTALSALSGAGASYRLAGLCLRALFLFGLLFYCHKLVQPKATVPLATQLLKAPFDWITLAALRSWWAERRAGRAREAAAAAAAAAQGEEDVMIVDGIDSVRQRRTERT